MILQMTRPVQGGLRQERRFDVLSNHIANVDTSGFKGDVLSFDRFMKAKLTVDLSQGSIRETGNKMDLALGDEGFFKVQTPFGTRYTRNGAFSLNNEGQLVTQNGDPVLGANGPIVLDGENIFINEQGEVQVDGEAIDTLEIVTFDNLENIQKEGSSYFVYKGSQEDEIAPQNILVNQGSLEGANVNSVTEMTNMIEVNRFYESFQKIIQSFDETDTKAINEVGKLE